MKFNLSIWHLYLFWTKIGWYHFSGSKVLLLQIFLSLEHVYNLSESHIYGIEKLLTISLLLQEKQNEI